MRMFPDDPGLYDLRKFAGKLPNGKEYRKLKGIIRNIYNHGSAYGDLAIAATQIRVARELELGLSHASDPNLLHAISAGYSWALILYIRATHTRSDHRDTINVVRSFSEEEKTEHRMLVSIRNDALAHYGAGPRPEKPWARDAVVLCINAHQDMKINTPPFRRAHMTQVNEVLERLIPKAKKIGEIAQFELYAAFLEEYERVLRLDISIKAKLASCVFDIEGHCESAINGARLYRDIMASGPEPKDVPIYRTAPTRYVDSGGTADA